MILACHHISKAFNDTPVLNDVSFHINEHERVALVGINGAGKTTLLRIIVGEYHSDAGEVIRAKDSTIGYLPQQQGYHSEKTIYEELLAVREDILVQYGKLRSLEQKMSSLSGEKLEQIMNQYHQLTTSFENSDGYAYQSKVVGVIRGLGFDDKQMHTCINHLSGGQKTRVALGKLLLTEPDLLLLDEPTNHLDIDSVKWLETYLSNYNGSVLIVSHDRYFLDKIADKIVEIDHAAATTFQGNYSDYAQKKEALRETLIKQYYNKQQEIKHQEQVIEKLRRFNREKSIKRAESREKLLHKLEQEQPQKPVDYEKSMTFTLTPSCVSGNDVLSVEHFSKRFGDNVLFTDINFDIIRGEKVAIIGANGTGKTTMLKMICGDVPVDFGTATTGTNVFPGYYDQEHQALHDDKTIFDEIHDDYPDLTHTHIRNVLAAFLFTGDDVFKPIHQLSGGEKGRVSLAKLMLSHANFLLLDEPTNHLDITSKEILETALKNYEGTVLYVSHDRYFIQKTATKILDLTRKQLLSYSGDYEYYLAKKETVENIHFTSSAPKVEKKESGAKLDWQAQKELDAKKRKLARSAKLEEDMIAALEDELRLLEEEFLLPENATDVAALTSLSEEKEKKEAALAEHMDLWEQLMAELEVI